MLLVCLDTPCTQFSGDIFAVFGVIWKIIPSFNSANFSTSDGMDETNIRISKCFFFWYGVRPLVTASGSVAVKLSNWLRTHRVVKFNSNPSSLLSNTVHANRRAGLCINFDVCLCVAGQGCLDRRLVVPIRGELLINWRHLCLLSHWLLKGRLAELLAYWFPTPDIIAT